MRTYPLSARRPTIGDEVRPIMFLLVWHTIAQCRPGQQPAGQRSSSSVVSFQIDPFVFPGVIGHTYLFQSPPFLDLLPHFTRSYPTNLRNDPRLALLRWMSRQVRVEIWCAKILQLPICRTRARIRVSNDTFSITQGTRSETNDGAGPGLSRKIEESIFEDKSVSRR